MEMDETAPAKIPMTVHSEMSFGGKRDPAVMLQVAQVAQSLVTQIGIPHIQVEPDQFCVQLLYNYSTVN